MYNIIHKYDERVIDNAFYLNGSSTLCMETEKAIKNGCCIIIIIINIIVLSCEML